MIPIQDTIPRRNPPVATYLLILMNILVFMFELTLPPPVRDQLFYVFGLVPARYTHPDWAVWVGLPVDDYWPFFTSMFLHGGWLHIIFVRRGRSDRRLARDEYWLESAWVPSQHWRVP